MVRALLGLAFVFMLAGCSSPPTPDDTVAPATFTSTATLSDLAPAEPVTDTMYLLDAPHMTASAPLGAVFRTPVPSVFDGITSGGSAAPLVEWSLPRDGLRVLEGNATLWVEVQGTVTNPNVPFSGGEACFWSVMIGAHRSDGGYSSYGTCLDEPTVVPPGVRELKVEFPAFDASEIIGESLFVAIGNSGLYGNGASVDVLSGSAEYPSRLSLRGLTLPLDTQTYL